MKRFKTFENYISDDINNDINIVLDTSGAIYNRQLKEILDNIDFGNYSSVNLIQVSSQVDKVDVLDDVNDIVLRNFVGGAGTNLKSALDYILDNNLQNNKTYIISDFYENSKTDWSILPDYEKIEVGQITEKKKASPAQLAARKKFAEMVAGKKKDAEPTEDEKSVDTKEVEKDVKSKDEKKHKEEKHPKDEKETKTEKKSKSKRIVSFGEHTGGFKP